MRIKEMESTMADTIYVQDKAKRLGDKVDTQQMNLHTRLNPRFFMSDLRREFPMAGAGKYLKPEASAK